MISLHFLILKNDGMIKTIVIFADRIMTKGVNTYRLLSNNSTRVMRNFEIIVAMAVSQG